MSPWASGDSLNSANLNNWGGNVSNPVALGAIGDGATNDTTAFFSAISAAVAAGGTNGGTVMVPPGTYLLYDNPFRNTIGTGNVPILMELFGAKLSANSQVKLPASTILRGSNRLRCGVFATSTFVAEAAISNITRTSNVVEVTTATAHGLPINGTSVMSSVASSVFNGGFQVHVTGASSFTYSQTGGDGGSSGGTVYIPLVVIGATDPFNQGTRLENLQVNASDITGSVGVFTNNANELAGATDVLIAQVAKVGLWIEDGGGSGNAINYNFRDIEILPTGGHNETGVYLLGTGSGQHRGFDGVSVVPSDYTSGIATGFDISGAPGLYTRLHPEYCVNGIIIGSREGTDSANSASAGIVIAGVTGNSGVSTLVRIKNAAEVHDIVLMGLVKRGGANLIVDELSGRTITASHRAFYTTADIENAGGSVVLDKTQAKITLDGTDSVVTAGSIGIVENSGSLQLSARGDVYALIDNDANGSTSFFGVYSNQTAIGGAPVFRVGESTTALFSASTIQITEAATQGALAGNATGTAGDIAWGASSGVSYLYVCTSANSWMRATLSPF